MPDSIRPVVIFALSTGLRRSNILDLEWTQVDMQRKVAWINPENAKAGKAIGVALNDTACRVLRGQIGKHSRWVFVHTKAGTRPDGTKTPAVRKMRTDDNTAWRIGLNRAGVHRFQISRPEAYVGQLADTVRRSIVSITGNGWMGKH